MRRATDCHGVKPRGLSISIHALHEESDFDLAAMHCARLGISIHALHEESDLGSMWGNLNLPISIHALHEESDEFVVSSISSQQKFQSTLSMRRATAIRVYLI